MSCHKSSGATLLLMEQQPFEDGVLQQARTNAKVPAARPLEVSAAGAPKFTRRTTVATSTSMDYTHVAFLVSARWTTTLVLMGVCLRLVRPPAEPRSALAGLQAEHHS